MLNRSVDRDYDIHYHTRAFRKALADLGEHYKALGDVSYRAVHLLDEMNIEWKRLQNESDLI